MPRNKNSKKLKKQQSDRNILSLVQQFEKDFQSLPAKLAARINKEVSAYQRKEAKLQKAFAKSESALVKTFAKVKQAEDRAYTSKGKKLLKAAKQNHKEALQNNNLLSKELKALSKTVSPLMEKQAKLTGLSKYLSQFDKHWAQTSKATKVKAKKAKVSDTSSITQLVIEPRVDSDESHADTLPLDELAKVAS